MSCDVCVPSALRSFTIACSSMTVRSFPCLQLGFQGTTGVVSEKYRCENLLGPCSTACYLYTSSCRNSRSLAGSYVTSAQERCDPLARNMGLQCVSTTSQRELGRIVGAGIAQYGLHAIGIFIRFPAVVDFLVYRPALVSSW
jgi:hypothetical protein